MERISFALQEKSTRSLSETLGAEIIVDYLKSKPIWLQEKSKVNSERASIIKIFLDRINVGRPCKYKDKNGKIKELKILTPRAIACRVAQSDKYKGCNNSDLYELDSLCRQGKNYVKVWFALTKKTKK